MIFSQIKKSISFLRFSGNFLAPLTNLVIQHTFLRWVFFSQLCLLKPPPQLLHGLLVSRPRRPGVLVVLLDEERKGRGRARRLRLESAPRGLARGGRFVVHDESEGAATNAATLEERKVTRNKRE